MRKTKASRTPAASESARTSSDRGATARIAKVKLNSFLTARLSAGSLRVAHGQTTPNIPADPLSTPRRGRSPLVCGLRMPPNHLAAHTLLYSDMNIMEP